jgi:DNA polymerase-3 subunit alpha
MPVARAVELGYPAVVISDHGDIAGWYDLYKHAKEAGIQPILSCEFYVCRDIQDTEENPFKPGVFRLKRKHLILHPKGQEGLQAIKDLYNKSWENYSEKGNKQIIYEKDILACAGKVLVQSACTGSYIDSEEKLLTFKAVFGDDFYLEIQPHQLDYDYDLEKQEFIPAEDKQRAHNIKMIQWGRTHQIKIIVTADSHYPTAKDKALQDVVILNSYVGLKTGWHFKQNTNHMMDADQWWTYYQRLNMEDVFSREDFENSLEIMQEIVEKTKGLVLESAPILRPYPLETHPLYAEGDTQDKLVLKIIKDLGRWNKSPEYIARFKYEFDILQQKGFLNYFLIVEDYIRWNRTNGFLTGPGRGSAAGCLLAYYLGITSVDPLKYGLLFERFLDLSRSEYPDIDVDFEMKEETVDYLTQKYGAENVMSIGAFQTMKVKSAIKNAYRVLYKDKDYDYSLVNDVTKEIPESNAREEGNQLDLFKDALKSAKIEFDKAKEKGEMWPRHNLFAFMMNKPDLINAVGKLLGKTTNARVHPCSIVITPKPVRELLPTTTIQSGTTSEKWVTAFDGPGVEACGQVKFDILGLTTINAISSCVREIKKHKPNDELIKKLTNSKGEFDVSLLYNIEPNDPKLFEVFAQGDTETVFQFNTDALKRMCKDIQVSSFNDLVAIVALVRPGPLKAGFPRLYMDRKFGKLGLDEMYEQELIKGQIRNKIVPMRYDHPKMREILKDTYGVICYQEQVQQIFISVGGFTPIESNKIRKAISKGKRSLIEESKPKFLQHVTTKLDVPWTVEQVDAFYEDMIGFGSYCFNKSHSVAYALLGYICQYLKVYYPLEWWSGNLEHAGEKGVEGILKIIRQKELVPIKSVDINSSKVDFYFNGQEIIMPFKYIDGVGDSGLEYIVKGQPYTSLEDFVQRMPGRSVRKNSVINLIVAGAFSSIEKDRTPQQLISYFLKDLKKEKSIPVDIQLILDDNSAFERKRSQVDMFYNSDWVEKFKGFFDSRVTDIKSLASFSTNAQVFIGGEVIKKSIRPIKTGKNAGQKMVFLTLRQLNDTVKVTIWPDQLNKYNEVLDNAEGRILEVQGKLSRYQGETGIVAERIKEIMIA